MITNITQHQWFEVASIFSSIWSDQQVISNMKRFGADGSLVVKEAAPWPEGYELESR